MTASPMACFTRRFGIRELTAATSFLFLLRVGICGAEDGEICPAEPVELTDTGWQSYLPNASVSAKGATSIEFTYSAEFLNQEYAGNAVALQADLDQLAWKLCDEIENPFGIPKPDLGVLFDAYQVTDYSPYAYGDPWFAAQGSTSGFLINQGRRYDIEVRGLPGTVPPASWAGHLDIVLSTLSVSYYGPAAGDPANELYRDNGIHIHYVPKAPEWGRLNVVMHEIGHVYDFTAFGQWCFSSQNDYSECTRREGFGQEPRANLGRRYCGLPGPMHGPTDGYPFNKCHYRDRECDPNRCPFPEPADWDYSAGRGDQTGETFWAYLAEHFNAGTPTDITDDLAPEFLTRELFKVDGTRYVNSYFSAFADLLSDEHYNNVNLYPYFSASGSPLPGKDRLAILFQNFSIAVGINAPELSVGEFGFPYEFDPRTAWQAFLPITPNRNRSELAPLTIVTAADFGTTLIEVSPHTMPDGSLYEMEIHPWNTEMWAFHLEADVDPGMNREVTVQVVGNGVPYQHPTLDYHYSVKASLVTFADVGGTVGDGTLHVSPEAVMAVTSLVGTLDGGNLVFTGSIPSFAGARNGLVVLSMVEQDMPEFMDETHPMWEALDTMPWQFIIEYTLQEATGPEILAKFDDGTSETQLDYDGQPYTVLASDLDRDNQADEDLLIAVNDGVNLGSYHRQDALTPNGVPAYQEGFIFQTGEEPDPLTRGAIAADVDNDGDLDYFMASGANAKFYENVNGSLVDRAAAWGISTGATNSLCGSFGDYDRDGDLDLFIGRGIVAPGYDPDPSGTAAVQDRLFRNDLSSSGTFTDVSVQANIDQDSERIDGTPSGSWADYDGDGDVDLVTARIQDHLTGGPPGPPSLGSLLYVNQGNGTFVESSDVLITDNILYHNGSVWVDYDQDSDLDLVVSTEGDQNFGGLRVYRNDDGTLNQATELWDYTQGTKLVGVAAVDQDLDGLIDLVGIPKDAGQIPQAFQAFRHANGNVLYWDQGQNLGLAAAKTGGVAVSDYNRDGDLDLLFGRPEVGANSKIFYRNTRPDGTDAPVNNYLVLKFSARNNDGSWDGGNNYYGVGATVNVQAPAASPQITVSRVIDGGSSRGGQETPGRLTFGLGQYTDALVTVRWPDGSQTIETVTSVNNSASPFEIRDDHAPGIPPATVTGWPEPQPGGLLDYVVSWRCTYTCDESRDEVDFRPYGTKPQCQFPAVTLGPGDPDVIHTVTPLAGGGTQHTLRWINRTCVPTCKVEYRVRSGFVDTSRNSESAWKNFTVPVCIQ